MLLRNTIKSRFLVTFERQLCSSDFLSISARAEIDTAFYLFLLALASVERKCSGRGLFSVVSELPSLSGLHSLIKHLLPPFDGSYNFGKF